MSERRVRLDHLLGVYAVGSGDWSWQDEYDDLIDQPGTQKLLARIRDEGIREPILLGTDGRVWDGHHRIVIAMHLGLDSVPVEFAGEDGALAVYTAEKQAEALQLAAKAIQGRVDPKATHCAMYVNAGLLLACDELSDRAQLLREQATNQVDGSTT